MRAEAGLARGRHAEVVLELRRLLADRPLREKLWSLLIRALYGAGRQAEALEVYEQARTRIATCSRAVPKRRRSNSENAAAPQSRRLRERGAALVR